MNIFRGIKRLIRNLIYLGSHELESNDLDVVYRTIRHTEDLVDTKMVFVEDDSIKVFSDEESWNKILSNPKSIIRFSDGEFTILMGGSIGFQDYDKRLADYLARILKDENDEVFWIGTEFCYFHGYDNIVDCVKKHGYIWGPIFKKVFLENCNPFREYISSSFNQTYINHIEYDWNKYIMGVKELFRGRDVVVFSGVGVLDGLKYCIFDYARSCEYVPAPSKNAFSEFNMLLAKARSFSKDKTLCFILGPTSKPLVYELGKDGYIAWDLGHMAKDYDCCMRKASKNTDDVKRFYAPD